MYEKSKRGYKRYRIRNGFIREWEIHLFLRDLDIEESFFAIDKKYDRIDEQKFK
jgi:hypothetical protein